MTTHPAQDAENKKALEACPFCKAGETNIHENHHSPTMSGGIKEPISVEIRHWCKGEGLPHVRINITGRDRQSAINAWNQRTTPAPQSEKMDGMGEVIKKLREAQTINIHQAAKAVTAQELPCYDPDSYKRHVPKWFLKAIEKLHERMNWNGNQLKKSADLIRDSISILTKEPNNEQ